ncbi:hypothetical protein ACHAQJ_004415 [Trichoderma viride]
MSGNASQILNPSALNEPLQKSPISASVRKGLIEALWSDRHTGTDQDVSMLPYFEYYSNRLQSLWMNDHEGFQVDSHRDIASISKRILSGETREEVGGIAASAAVSEPDDDDVNYGIDTCASLVVMVEIEFNPPKEISALTRVPWKTGSLADALACYFCPQIALRSERPKLGKVFTARNLTRMAGIEVQWTTNLADHLCLGKNDQVVYIFHCASFLQFQQSLRSSPFPESFLQETLDTLALLFPSTDKETTKWLGGIKNIDPQLAECHYLCSRKRRFDRFNYWHDQLVILKQAFDESSPRSISNWWYDTRDGVRWYTFWVAILVFAVSAIFGIVQIVEGALQVYLAYKSA